MVKQLLCINGDLKGFTNGQLYTIVPNELNPSFEKWVIMIMENIIISLGL